MPTLIDLNGPRADDWIAFDGDAGSMPRGASVLLPLDEWRTAATLWRGHAGRIGVLLAPADDPAAIAADLGELSLVAVSFPSFTDGRGYSTARLLRERYGYRGELRAVGEVLRDQLSYLARCGFDSFALADGQDVAAALSAFADFGEAYQAAADRGPLFWRRFAPSEALA
jgi:uncharacterized protein (DUF934 family)